MARKPEPDWRELIASAGLSIEDLLGSEPLSDPPPRSAAATIFGAPFRMILVLARMPVRLVAGVVKLPFRLLKAVLPPWRRGS